MQTGYLVYFAYGDGNEEFKKVFLKPETADAWALKIGSEVVGRRFQSKNEMDVWFNEPDPSLEKAGRVIVQEVPIVED